MKKIALLVNTLLLLLLAGKATAQIQNLVCNDLVQVSLDENCTYTLVPDEVLEGAVLPNSVVELDKTSPFGNGPWLAPDLTAADIGQTYQFRVRQLPSGISCTGNLLVEDKLPPVMDCAALSTVSLNGGNQVTVPTNTLLITANDACGNSSLSPASLQYNCNDLGIHTLQLQATDMSGNTSTCKHTVLVTDGANCQPCVNTCPLSATVSFDEGNLNLLPAFQNSNWAAFDPYGSALFNTACSYVDSVYSIDYQVGTAGQSWFVRQWQWTNAGGQIIPCEQVIVFPTTHKVTVHGTVYIDSSQDCNPDNGEQGINHYPLVLTKLPSGVSQTFYPNPDGTYAIEVDFTVQDLSAQLFLDLPANINPVCPSAIMIPNSSATPDYLFNIGIQTQGDCPKMQVDIGDLFMRRCVTNIFSVQYCNMGLDTAFGAFITLNLDPHIHLQGASLPFTVAGPDSIYTFQIGNVAPFECGAVYVSAKVGCNTTSGQTLCNEANIFPDTPCNGSWQGARLEADAVCDGDSVSLQLKNTGIQNMSTPLDYIVVEDFIMYKQNGFQLNAGQSVEIRVPASGNTWRIEAPQIPGYPVPGLVSASIEGCGGLNSTGVINALGYNNNAQTYDQYCGQVVGSYDPNDKIAVPFGVGDQHITRKNESIEYKIRFQNTGTATAYRVVVVDTLSALLDWKTLDLGASSHPYQLEIYPGGILHFVFDPIALPDSNANESESHGYLKFTIAQQPELADGTRIENTASIYFDENDPVRTNTSFHTIGYPYVPNDPLVLTAQTASPSCADLNNGAIQLSLAGGVPPYAYQWSDAALQGDHVTGLLSGTYTVTMTDSYRGELVQTFVLDAPPPIQLVLNASPETGDQQDGTALALATGGVGAFTYAWNNGAVSNAINGLTTGIYTVTATDANGCTQSNSVSVGQNILPLVVTVQSVNPTCHNGANGSIELALTGGLSPYEFRWSDPDLQGASETGLSAGSYLITVTDAAGNEWIQTVELTEPAAIDLNLQTTPVLGNQQDGSASVVASGGTGAFTYLWSNGATSDQISGLNAGIYTVTVTDGSGCTQNGVANVEQTVLPLVIEAQASYPTCFGAADGSIHLIVSGGLMPYTIHWDNPDAQGDSVLGLVAGIYNLTLTDAFGGEITQSIQLNDPAPILLALSSTPTIGNAQNGTASAIAAGGTGPLTYAWSNGENTVNISGLSAGVYALTVTDANGCTETEEIVVEQLVESNEPGNLPSIRIWPNPAHEMVTADLHLALPELSRLDVFDPQGRILCQFTAEQLSPILTLNVEKQADGFIVLAFYGKAGGVSAKKIVIH